MLPQNRLYADALLTNSHEVLEVKVQLYGMQLKGAIGSSSALNSELYTSWTKGGDGHVTLP